MAVTRASAIFPLLLLLLLLHLLSSGLAAARQDCPPFSCGQLRDVENPFRRKDDPALCGEPTYQLSCDANRSTFRIGSTDYSVTQISYENSTFRLVDPNFANGSCGLPAQPLSPTNLSTAGHECYSYLWASFMNCSEAIQNDTQYHLLSCLSHKDRWFVYVIVAPFADELDYLHPGCEYLSMIPAADDAFVYYDPPSSSIDPFSILQKGFDCNINIPGRPPHWKSTVIHQCLNESISMFSGLTRSYHILTVVSNLVRIVVIVLIQIVQLLIVLFILGRFVVAPIALFVFLAHKLWVSLASVDAVEKFLRAQQMLTPTRYAYTDIVAITRHFRQKLGQGGFGSVFKGELAGGLLVAVKLLGNSNCNGDEFISEVATIGRIHHVNVGNSLVSVSAARGTVGYIAPELISRSFGIISHKSDVYSFGMLLLEMAGRRRNVDPRAQNSSQVYYPSWIYDKLTTIRRQQEIQLDDTIEIEESEKKLSVVGLWCIQIKPSERPTMAKVMEMLEADASSLPIPPKPFFSSVDSSTSQTKTCLTSSSAQLSIISE
ncbi:hypothetical protein OPV22_008298 [Ensete ventricosum]|uniref:Protein kinase domain-containing protein n=1 Tax=Ensete ventricosum TaxID=4639 RepID=A0AAV8R6A6_ENSVE|nr:hypothetical protein OPV22_008298 [Ensete ventricosum]